MKTATRKRLGCPHCGSAGGFTLDEVVCLTQHVLRFEPNGEVKFAGLGDIAWDTAKPNPESSTPYACKSCGKAFREPVAIEA